MSTQDRIKRYILLEQSGELSPRRRAWLARQVERNPDARAWRDTHIDLIERIKMTARDEPLPDFTWEQIKAAGRAEIQRESRERRRRPAADFVLTWKPALIYGSLSVLLIGVWFWWASPDRPGRDMAAVQQPAPVVADPDLTIEWHDPIDAQIAELYALLDATLDDVTSTSDPNGTYNLDDELNNMAYELLSMEGS